MTPRKRSVDIDLDGLVDQPRSALVDLWQEAFDEQPPRGLRQAFQIDIDRSFTTRHQAGSTSL